MCKAPVNLSHQYSILNSCNYHVPITNNKNINDAVNKQYEDNYLPAIMASVLAVTDDKLSTYSESRYFSNSSTTNTTVMSKH